jgi:hypothetical protein
MVCSELAFVVLTDMAVLKELFVSVTVFNIKSTTLMLLSCVAAGTEIQRF